MPVTTAPVITARTLEVARELELTDEYNHPTEAGRELFMELIKSNKDLRDFAREAAEMRRPDNMVIAATLCFAIASQNLDTDDQPSTH